MRARMIGGALAIGLAVASLTAGGDDDKADGTTTSTTTSTVAGSDTTALGEGTVVPGNETDGDRLLDGKHFGYITTLVVEDDEVVGDFDLAELYTGKAAEREAAKDGSEVTDDSYIRNEDPKLRTITVDPDATVLDVDDDYCCEPSNVSVNEFVLARDTKGEERTTCYITIEDGLVTRIEEVYFP